MRKLKRAKASIAAWAVAGPALAQPPIVIKFSHVVAPNTPKGQAAESSGNSRKSRPTARSGSRSIRTPLYKDKEELEALQLGAVQMLAPSNSKFGPLGVKEFEVFDLPYIFAIQARCERSRGARRRAAPALGSKGITGLAYWDNGSRRCRANNNLIAPADYKRPQDAHPGFQGAGSADPDARRNPPGDSVSAGYPALQARVVDGRKTPGRICARKRCTRCRNTSRCPTTVILDMPSSSTRSSGTACRRTSATSCEKAMKEATSSEKASRPKENDEALEAIRKTARAKILRDAGTGRGDAQGDRCRSTRRWRRRIGQPLIDEFLKETRRSPEDQREGGSSRAQLKRNKNVAETGADEAHDRAVL